MCIYYNYIQGGIYMPGAAVRAYEIDLMKRELGTKYEDQFKTLLEENKKFKEIKELYEKGHIDDPQGFLKGIFESG